MYGSVPPRPPDPEVELPGPTRPDRISIWPVEDDRYGIDVLYTGAIGFRRADQVVRQLEATGVGATLRQEADRGWLVRLGPVDRATMLAALNGYVW